MMKQTRWIVGALALTTLATLSGCSTMGMSHGAVKTAPMCQEQRVQIYFEPDSAEVTAEGRAVIRQAALSAKGCKVDSVEVLGLADAVGTPDANLDISKRRAQAVTAALAGAGLPAGEFKVAAAGQAGAVTAAGEARPLRRRADVVLHLSAPK
jgi:peptidoglycan-associated lipoprotein